MNWEETDDGFRAASKTGGHYKITAVREVNRYVLVIVDRNGIWNGSGKTGTLEEVQGRAERLEAGWGA